MSRLHFKTNDRVFICGRTGSGKTFLAKRLCASLNRLVILDGKGTLNDWNTEPWGMTSRYKLLHGQPVRIRVQAPMTPRFNDLARFWDEVIYTAYRAQNCVIYMDELYAIVPPESKASAVLFGAYTRGRELGVGVWASTQRPVWIPLVAISESDHFVMFRLMLEEDKRRVAVFMGQEVLAPIPLENPYGFYYATASSEKPVYYSSIQEVSEGSKPISVTSYKAEPILNHRS